MRDGAAAAAKLAGWTAGLAFGYSLLEAHWYTVRRISVPILPTGAAPLSLLHISDLHLMATQRRKAAWIADLAQLEPDLVISTGDHIGQASALDLLNDALEPLLGLPGGFVFGSNDFFTPALKNPLAYLRHGSKQPRWRRPDLPMAELRSLLMAGGWADLNNSRAAVSLAAGSVQLVGLADPHLGFDRLPSLLPDAGAAPLLKLGIVHAPYLEALRSLMSDGAQLVLAGHTHGGQVALPFWGALVTNSDLPARFARGLIPLVAAPGAARPLGQRFLHISAGLGTSPYTPIRFACRPEATLLTLVPSTSS
ncbi:MAG: metallophosphoesterase family protein [Micrococcales bacterium]|nr:metallophosphoesterase family protein [Micrococcales bacterium]